MTKKQLSDDIELDSSLKLVAQSFTEVAAIKLQRIRSNIERNRGFIGEISGLFAAVGKLAEDKGVTPQIARKGTVAILVTSNYRFYGGLERRLINFYLDSIKNMTLDRLTIGQSALDYFGNLGHGKNFQNVIWKDDLPNEEELKKLAETIHGYQRILVFYSFFQSVLVQKPVIYDVSASSNQASDQVFKIDYILEPEIDKMWRFFETQILGLLLDQVFLESELSRTAARLISMDQAQENADESISSLKKIMAIVKRSESNQKILETESAMFKIRKANYDSG